MARTITTDVSLARPGIEKIVKQFQEARENFYPQILGKEMSTRMAFDRFKGLSDFGEATVVNEGTDIPVSDFQTPFQRDFYVVQRGIGYEVTAQAAYTDLYNEIKKPTENMIQSIYDAREQSAANLLNLGHTTPGSGGTWTLDNAALFSAAHPLNAGTGSNTGALALGILNLETAVQSAMQVQTYMGKVWVGPRRWKLVVPTQLLMLAKRLVVSDQFPTTNDNDKNVAKDHLQVVWEPFLSDPNNWYLIPADGRYNPLFRMNRKALELVSDKIPRRAGDMFYGYVEEYGDGAEEWRGTFGANPS